MKKQLIERITRYVAPLTRTFALLFAVCAATSAWAETYTYSNVDSDSLATTSDGAWYLDRSCTFVLNNPSGNHAVGNFPSSGYVQLTSISMAARASGGKDATTATLTNNKTSESYPATVTYVDKGFTADLPSTVTDESRRAWTRTEVHIVFGADGVLVDTTATYTLTFNAKNGCSVVNRNNAGWKPAMRIYGRTPSGSMLVYRATYIKDISFGGEVPALVALKDATGFSISGDNVTVPTTPIMVPLSSDKVTVIAKVDNIPSSNSALAGVTLGNKNQELVATRTSTGFRNSYVGTGGGNLNGTTTGWGVASATSVTSGEHWIAAAYASDTSYYGLNTYLDGSGVACTADPNGLRWSGGTVSWVTIGGSKASINSYSDATPSMGVKSVNIFSGKLAAGQVATITAALNKGWTVNAAGTTLTATELCELPNHANVQAVGSLTVAADGSYTAAGLTQVQVLEDGSFDIGTARPTILGVASTGTLAVTPTGATVSEQIEGYAATASLTVTGNIDGTVTLGGVTVTPDVADGTAKLTGVMAANPTYTGESWWWDYEFNGTVTSIGLDKGGMTTESSGADVYDNSTELYFQQTPWRDATFSDKNELTAVMYCQPGNYANAVLVGFGSTTEGEQKAIALVTGANPSAGEMKLVLTDGHSGTSAGTVTTLANLTAVGATTTKHLYAFVMDRITENETTKTRIRVYLDGKVKAIYKHNGTLTLSNGFQIGSLHGGVAPRDDFITGLGKYSATGNSGTLDFLRVVDGTLTDAAMSALAREYPYNSEYGKATRDPVSSSANWKEDSAWSQTVSGVTTTQDKPNDNTNVTLSKGGASGVSVAINLTSDSNYESLTLGKEAGAAGSLKLTSGYGSGSGKLKSAETSVLVDTTIPAGRVNLGITSVADGVTLTVDPYSTLGNSTIADTLYGLSFGEVYEDVIISMALLGDGARVVLDDTNVAALTGEGFTVTLDYNDANQSYTFKAKREDATTQNIAVNVAADGTAAWLSNNRPLGAPDSLPSTYTGTVTIDCTSGDGTTIATTFNGGEVKLTGTTASSPAINFTGGRVVFSIPSGETLYLNGTVAPRGGGDIVFTGGGTVVCSAADTLQGTVKGSATIQYPTGVLPVVEDTGVTHGADFTDAAWTGTNVFTSCVFYTGETRKRTPFERYGNEHSFIKAPGFKGYAADTEQNTICQAELIIDEGTTFEFNHGWQEAPFSDADVYAEDQNANFKFRKLSGTGKLKLDGTTDYAQYIFCDVSDFTGDVEITFPGIGGRKSYLFGAPANYSTVGSAYPANLVIMDSVTVPASKTWTIPAGVVISESATLKLGASSTITALSSISRGTLKVESGTANVTTINDSVVNAVLDIAANATLCINDTAITKLTIPAEAGVTYKNSGTLDLRGCTNLAELYLELGDSKTFDFAKVTLPGTCTKVYYYVGEARSISDTYTGSFSGTINYIATETYSEFESGNFTMTNVPAGAEVWVIRKTGATVQATPPSEGSTDRTYSQGGVFSGSACWHEWDFELADRLKDTGKHIDTPSAVAIATDDDGTLTDDDYTTWELANGEPVKRAISAAVHPTAKTTAFSDNWSAAVRCTMPTDEGKHVAVAFGDTDNGVIGLAYDQALDIVELFKWNSATYTPLANMQVESATNKMHIYVIAVTNDTDATTRYVSFYRDGEFIHKTLLDSPTTITQFKVGGVVEGTAERTELPADAASGWVDYVRLYDKTLDAVIAEGLSARRPFVSEYPTYVREVVGNVSWESTNAWEKQSDGTTAETPTDDSYVTLLAAGQTAMSVNLTSDAAYKTLIFAPADDAAADTSVTIGSGGTGKKISADMIVVRAPVTVEYGAVNFPDAMVGVDEGASLTFNFGNFPYEGVTGSTNVYLTGRVVARQYDESVDGRIRVAGKPSDTWTVGNPTYESLTGRYYVTIELDHMPGDEVYYTGGYWSSTESSFAVTNASGKATTVLEGDTVVIPDYISGDRANDAYIGSPLPENVTKIQVNKNYKFMPGVSTEILGGAQITVATGSTLSFADTAWNQLKLGAVTLNGAVSFTDDVEATSIAGDAAITINGKTLTLDTNSDGFTGSFSGTGTVKIKSVAGEGFDVSHYMPTYGTLALASMNTYFKETSANAVNVTSALRLDGDVEISELTSTCAYTFAKIAGTGDFTIPADTCAGFTISKIEDYSGSLNTDQDVTVSKISLSSDPKAGTLLLKTSGTGTVTVSSVEVGGERASWSVAYAEGGVYKPAATYNGILYIDIAEAIAQAESAGAELSAITVHDTSVTLPVGYEISAGIVAKKASSYTWGGDEATDTWNTLGNWSVAGETPARLPDSVDTVTFTYQTTVVLPANTTVGTVNCDKVVTLNKSGVSDVELTASSVVLTAADASITLGEGVSLSATPTTTVPNGVVASTTADGVTKHYVATKTSTTDADGTTTIDITPPADVTSINVTDFGVADGNQVVVPATVTKITGTTAEKLILKVSYNDGTDSATYPGILKLDESGNVSLDGTKSVTVGVAEISVTPTVDASAEEPMAVDDTATPAFAVKAIPGLWYAVKACDDPAFTSDISYGDSVQASGTTVNPEAPTFDGTVKYYKIVVAPQEVK